MSIKLNPFTGKLQFVNKDSLQSYGYDLDFYQTFYDNTDTNSAGLTANIIYNRLILIPRKITISEIAIEYTSTDASNRTVVGLYDVNKNTLQITDKIVQTGEFNGSTAGVQAIAITPTVIKPGIYAVATNTNTNISYRVQLNQDITPTFGHALTNLSNRITRYDVSSAYSPTLPATMPTGGTYTLFGTPVVGFK